MDENLPPVVIKTIMKELRSLERAPMEGISIEVPDDNLHTLHAIFKGPVDTPYHNGTFEVRLKLTNTFPSTPPKAMFTTQIFHPNVAPETGEICVNTLKKDWSPTAGLAHVLLVIRCLLIVPNPDSALNEDAGKLLREDYDAYATRARIFTRIYAGAADGAKSVGIVMEDTSPNKKNIQTSKKKRAKKGIKRL